MAHTCPECEQYCTCLGDWDDIVLGEPANCIHCPELCGTDCNCEFKEYGNDEDFYSWIEENEEFEV